MYVQKIRSAEDSPEMLIMQTALLPFLEEKDCIGHTICFKENGILTESDRSCPVHVTMYLKGFDWIVRLTPPANAGFPQEEISFDTFSKAVEFALKLMKPE